MSANISMNRIMLLIILLSNLVVARKPYLTQMLEDIPYTNAEVNT